MPRVDYPRILTKFDWDANKGLIAKMHGETGLGAACETAERKYNLINWRIFDASNSNSHHGDTIFINQLTEVEFRRHVLPAAEYVLELKGKCDQVATSFQHSNAIPMSSRLHVEKMSEAAETFSRELRGVEKLKLAALLYSPIWRQRLLAFCQSEFSSENLEFLLAVTTGRFYPIFPPTERILLPAGQAREIFSKFIAGAAPKQINLPNDIRAKLVTAAGIKDGEKGCLAEADWRDAVYDIYRLVQKDTLRRFNDKVNRTNAGSGFRM